MVYPCDCTHHIEYDESDVCTVKEWHDFVYKLCEGQNKTNQIDIDFLPKQYKYPNPIYSHKQ